jgi:DNA polymerase I
VLTQQSLSFPTARSEWIPPDLPSLEGITSFALDTETTGKNPFLDKPVGISLAYRAPDVRKVYLPFGHSQGNLDENTVRNWIAGELQGKEIVFCNAKYDLHVLKNWGVDLESLGVKPRDVAFNAALLDDNQRGGLDLESLAERYTNVRKLKFNGNLDRMADYPAWMASEYAERDAEATLLVDEATLPLIRKEDLERVLALENSLIYFVCEIERNGCRLDVPKLEQWRREIRADFERVVMHIQKATGLLINPGSGDDMRALFKVLGLQAPARGLPKCTACKAPRRSENETHCTRCGRKHKKPGKPAYTVEELVGFKHPVMDQVVAARQLESLLVRFFDKWHDALRGGEVLRSQYHQLKFTEEDDEEDDQGAVSGRFSSSGSKKTVGYSFNAQQTITPDLQIDTLGDHHIVRELFIPEDGMEYGAYDASQIEYRLYAALSKAPKIIAAYRDDPNTDFHQLVRNMLLPLRPTIKRGTVKNVNFAKLYRAQPPQLAATAGISLSEAEDLFVELDRIFPEAERFSTQVEREAMSKGFVSTIMGRRARLTDRFHSATNRVVQGGAADLMKAKLVRIYRERKTIGITKLRQMVHDEQCFDLDPDPKYKKLIAECFNTQEVPLAIPITWKGAFGQNWRECK